MRRLLLATMLLSALTACDGGADTLRPSPSEPAAEPTVGADVAVVCADLGTYVQRIEHALGRSGETVARAQEAAASAVDALDERVGGLDEQLGAVADDIARALRSIRDWRPEDADSLDDLLGSTAQRIDEFQRAFC
jgi:phage-related minor tail protein